jgi:hypothetical protein
MALCMAVAYAAHFEVYISLLHVAATTAYHYCVVIPLD